MSNDPKTKARTGMLAMGRTCVNGEATTPTSNAREKFSVASDERNMPSNSSEKDFISSYCCEVGLK